MVRTLAAVFLVVLAGCTSSTTGDTSDAAPICACEGSGITVHYFYGIENFCPVFQLGLTATFPSGTLLPNDIQCIEPTLPSMAGKMVLPWPNGAQAGEVGTISLSVSGDGGFFGSGEATVTAAPDKCAEVTIHLSCVMENPDAGGLDAAR